MAPRSRAEIVRAQRAALERLQQEPVRRMYLDWLVGARRSGSPEPAPTRFERPAVDRIRPLRGDGDMVPVVRGEILARAREGRGGQLDDLLGPSGFVRVDDVTGNVRRYRHREAGGDPARVASASLASATEEALEAARAVDSAELRADPNHLFPLAWDMKGGDVTAELTDERPKPREAGEGEPLVVVIDTGLYAGAGDRDDGILSLAVMHDARDEDLLDVLDVHGAVDPDGHLDLGAGHGTFVAGIVAQVAPHARVTVIKALATDGVGTDTQLAAAIRRSIGIFAQHGGRGVLNLSLGGHTYNDQLPIVIADALDGLPDDVLVVAAAGNTGGTREVFPAADARVYAVGAVDETLQATTWSNHGTWVDFSAVGEGIVSTFVPGEETKGSGPDDPFDDTPDTFPKSDPCAMWSGTSFATPQVSAWLASYLAANPGDPASKAVAQLHQSGDPVPGLGHAVRIL